MDLLLFIIILILVYKHGVNKGNCSGNTNFSKTTFMSPQERAASDVQFNKMVTALELNYLNSWRFMFWMFFSIYIMFVAFIVVDSETSFQETFRTVIVITIWMGILPLYAFIIWMKERRVFKIRKELSEESKRNFEVNKYKKYNKIFSNN